MTKQEWIRYLYSEMRYYQPLKVFQGIRREHVEGKERFMKWMIIPLEPQPPFVALDEFMVPKKPSDRRTVTFRIERSLDGKPFGPPRWWLGTIEDFAQEAVRSASVVVGNHRGLRTGNHPGCCLAETREEGHPPSPTAVVIDAVVCEADEVIHTLEGDHLARAGDYIITGIKGERYPCKPDIFRQTYELVPEASTGRATDGSMPECLVRDPKQELRARAERAEADAATLRVWLKAALDIIRTELPEYVGGDGFVTEADIWLAKHDTSDDARKEKK